MLKPAILLAACFPLLTYADGSIIIQPQADGSNRIIVEGKGGSDDMLSLNQPAGKAMNIQLTASSSAQCREGYLEAGRVRIALQLLTNNQKLSCGEFVELGVTTETRQVLLRLQQGDNRNRASAAMIQGASNQMAIGTLAVQTGEVNDRYSIYLDSGVLQATVPVLTAKFETAGLEFGLVGPQNDATAHAKLLVSKTVNAPTEMMPYQLTFESSQQQSGVYRLRSSLQGKLIPYRIFIGGREVVTDSPWHGLVPAGVGTTDRVDIEFHLPGKATKGMPAGTRLLDTVTAVITPES